MLRTPVLIVLRPEPAEVVVGVLAAAGIEATVTTARAAAEKIGLNEAVLVVCERTPGWQALIRRVETAGGAALLLGPRPTRDEERYAQSHEVECVEDIDQLVAAIRRAEQRRRERLSVPEVDDLPSRLRSAEHVAEFAQSIASQLELPQVLAESMARTRDLCGADSADVLLVNPATGELASALSDATTVELGIRIAREAAPVLVEDVASCPELSAPPPGSLIAVPLLQRGDVLGAILARRSAPRAPFTAAHLRRLEMLAPHVTIAVHNARVNAGLREAQTQVVAANHALEEKVRARTALIARGKREWEETFDAILEPLSLQEGFVTRRANLAYARQVGLPITQLPGRRCHELLAGRDSPCPSCPLLASEARTVTGELTLPDETVHSMNAFRMEESGLVVVHYRDVTGEKHLAARLRESERLAALGQLASGAAHEINNPVGFMMSNLNSLGESLTDLRSAMAAIKTAQEQLAAGRQVDPELLLGGASPEALDELLEDGTAIIEESLEGARRVAAIVRGLRELSRQELGVRVNADVNASLSRVLRRECPPGVELEQRLAARVPVWMAPLHLDQLFEHVLRNAQQSLGATRRIAVRSEDLDGQVRIEIEDSGCGIAPENLTRVFEPFFSTRGVGRGVGLGLTVAYGVVRRAGGSIELTSQPGEGTRVVIVLPHAAPQPSEAEALRDVG